MWGGLIFHHVLSFVFGLLDSLGLWKIGSSRTLSNIALRVIPLYISYVLIGIYFLGLQQYYTGPTTQIVWLIGWGVPAYLVGSILQLRYTWIVTNKAPNDREKQPFGMLIAEGIYGASLSITYLAQTYIYCLIIKSFFNTSSASLTLNVIMIAWATSFAAFDCRLIISGQDLSQRIKFIETRWAYALGYGLPASLIYNLFPGVLATGVWQYLQLLLTLRAITIKSNEVATTHTTTHRLRIFRFAQYLATLLIKYVNNFF